MKTVSFVTINYNNAPGLDKTLAELLKLKEIVHQAGWAKIELVVVDGLSGPADQKVIETHRPGLDVVVSESDDGIYDAMNKGIRLAGGDFVNFMHSGDVPINETMARLIESIELEGGYYFGKGRWPDRVLTVQILRDKLSNFWLKMPNHQAMFIPLDWHKQNLYSTKYPTAGDTDIKLKLNKEVRANKFDFDVVDCEPQGVSQATDSFRSLVSKSNEVGAIALRHNGCLSAALIWARHFLSHGVKKYVLR